ncbi:hypothetical protein C0993_006258 [Termitomyces sp. T159_Od127]|nr:hypothetical protein C0993_006258 [Termitomyces sp. T159_Od127]
MAGLLEWSNAIRFTMENDPGRENFQSHLNTHGFVFLDDYLENILSGPCQESPIIELVKTPGRKKMTSKKSKGLGLSGSRTVPSLKQIDLERGQKPEEKAATPLNTLDKGLRQATVGLPTLDAAERLSQEMITSDQPTVSSDLLSTQIVVDSSTSDSLTPDVLLQNDLSVIAEDDENPDLKTHSTVDSPSPQINVPHEPVTPPLSPTLPEFDSTKAIDDVSKTNTSTPHTLLRDTMLGQPRVELPDTHALDPNTGSCDFGLLSQDLSQVPPSGDKHGVASFPTLPAPIPLRKSVRTSRDPSVSTGHTGATTPVTLQGGKRTSWLKKAREVKALEVTIKHPHTNTTLLAVSGAPSENILKRKSVEVLVSPDIIATLDLGRNLKSVKSSETDEAPLKAMAESSQIHHKTPLMVDDAPRQDGVLDRFKRTVEDLGAKVGKSINKSLGAAAATSALAEARAAAEARVVERIQKEEELTRNTGSASSPALVADIPAINRSVNPEDKISKVPSSEERRLSVSDLCPPTNRSIVMKDDLPSRTTETSRRDSTLSPELDQSRDPTGQRNRESTTTTPPDSPPTPRHTSAILHSEAVLGKHPPVFIPPVSVSNILLRDHGMDWQSTQTFPLPVPMPLGLGTRIQLPSSSRHTGVLSRQPTMESVQSNEIFDRTDSAAWMSETQDTDHLSRYGSQSQIICQTPTNADDSWPTQERLPPGMKWTFSDTMKEDSMTWSTLPSQKEDSGRLDLHTNCDAHGNELEQSNIFPTASGIDTHNDLIVHGDSDLKDITHQSAISLVEKALGSNCQVSTPSLQSSRSYVGLTGQSSRPLGSALGVSKKGNPEVKKVFQMAATAAKKQQEENDKKVVRLKEMDNRRQLAMQRKAEESRSRTLEQERKIREEGERRKREREENTDKRPTKSGLKDEDNGKKRKIASFESQKREAKKLLFKPIPKPSSLKPHSALGSSTAHNVSVQAVANSFSLKDSRPLKPPLTACTVKGKTPPMSSATNQDNISQPSQLVQIQMAARAKAQIQTAHLTSESQVISESIELPEINSEYSDSDDEDRSKALPGWAQSPELRQALQLQSTINPDDIFGAIRPLRMEEMFKDPNSLFRARTSSANWTGTDRLTMEEEREYAKRMGFK